METRPSLKNVLNVSAAALASTSAAQIYNRGLFVVDSDLISYDDGVLEFTGGADQALQAIGKKFGTNSQVYIQADAYFSGLIGWLINPNSLLIAKDIRNFNVPAVLFGNSRVDLVALVASAAGNINFSFDNHTIPVAITAPNIASGPTGIATVIQTALRAYTAPTIQDTNKDKDKDKDLSNNEPEAEIITKKHTQVTANIKQDNATTTYPNATCVFDPINNQFIVKSGNSGDTAIISYATGDAIATTMRLTSLQGARTQQGRTGATINQQMYYILGINANWAMMGYLTPITYTPGGTAAQNQQLLDQLNWFKDPIHKFFVNKYQFCFTTSDTEDLTPDSPNSLYNWLITNKFAETRELLLDDNSIFRYTVFNTNVTFIWDRENINRMIGGVATYGASWQLANPDTFPSWNNAVVKLVPNNISNEQYLTLTEHGFNVYTSFSPALVATTMNRNGTCGVITATNGDFTDIMYLSQWYIMRTLRASIELSINQLIVSTPNFTFPDPTSTSPDTASAIAKMEDAITAVVNIFLASGIYIQGKIFDLTDPYDVQTLNRIQLIANQGTTKEFIINAFTNPKYLLQFRRVTSSTKISGKLFAKLVYCVANQMRSIDLGTIATN